MISDTPPGARVTTSVSRARGLDESQNESINGSEGIAKEKNRRCLDARDSLAKKDRRGSRSSFRESRNVAVVPSRKISRPDSAES